MTEFVNDPRNPVYESERRLCPECDGDGEVWLSCCGDNMKTSDCADLMICPTCHEHIGDDKEKCEWCDGTGYVEPKDKFERENFAELTKLNNSENL